ncbi:MAG: SCO family protein [Aestuariivirga sp.]
MTTTSNLRKAVWAMAVLCAAILGLVAYGQWTGEGVKQDFGTFGAPFKLASTKGGDLDSQTLSGKPYGIFFGFTHCPEVCPTTLFEMSASLKELGDNAKDFRLLFITVDPEQDTVPIVKDYLSNFDPRIEGLVPTVEQLPKLARDFHIYYKKEPTSDGSYTMDHTATLFLMDKAGKLKSTISFDENRATRTSKLKNLMAAN